MSLLLNAREIPFCCVSDRLWQLEFSDIFVNDNNNNNENDNEFAELKLILKLK